MTWTDKQMVAASAMADSGRQMLNMFGHAGHLHNNDAVVQKFMQDMDAFEFACMDASPKGDWHGRPSVREGD